ncbi:hypothetical protein BZA05DRAFT_408340 [Tricharina praecox]|uniref:uncharacterized protein n=1 Tax=Tricharina praecox TaxID=43433 RepID=UPI00221E4280|nr:uncharacterized protein BZA05DRAFT_408340 [Tricharina praecox]KAI5845380.1 hypothetical protein BZA05DRAFT_408340 [Tricharina praecox]
MLHTYFFVSGYGSVNPLSPLIHPVLVLALALALALQEIMILCMGLKHGVKAWNGSIVDRKRWTGREEGMCLYLPTVRVTTK